MTMIGILELKEEEQDAQRPFFGGQDMDDFENFLSGFSTLELQQEMQRRGAHVVALWGVHDDRLVTELARRMNQSWERRCYLSGQLDYEFTRIEEERKNG